MRSEMFFPKEEQGRGIISKNKPPDYDKKKKVILKRGIDETEYEDVVNFLKEHNLMSSGNFTLLTKENIEKYKKMGAISVLMRNENNKQLIGTIFSIPFPIRCNVVTGIYDNVECTKNTIITHGCTTFLNVHSKIRGFNMCMILIRELAQYAHENNIFCSYQLSSFKMCETAVEINSWYRPINLMRSLMLGFTFPGFNEIGNFQKNRIMYKCKAPKNYIIKEIKKNNLENSLIFYNKMIENKIFVFAPDTKLFEKWINEYSSYIVKYGGKIIGIFSITTVVCKMANLVEGRLCLPLLFNSDQEHSNKVLKCLLSIAQEKDYDVLYCYQKGDLTQKLFTDINAIPTPQKSFFSLYNNDMHLEDTDICVPLF